MEPEGTAIWWIGLAIASLVVLAPATALGEARECTEDLYVGTAGCNHETALGECYVYVGGDDGGCVAYGDPPS